MTDTKKEKLLVITDGPILTTGLARICKEVCARFLDKYEIAVAGWHQPPTRHDFPYFIYPLVKGGESEIQLRSILADFKPDNILCIGDIWDFAPMYRSLMEYRDINTEVKNLLWVTVDGEWSELSWDEIMRPFDNVVSMSSFGVKEVNNLTERIKCRAIFPGVDTDVFRPLGKNMKISHMGKEVHLKNIFSVLNLGQNHDRKNIPATIEAFAEFAKDKPDVFLFLGTDPKAQTGHNIFAIVKKNKIEDKLSVIKNISPLNGISDKHINLVYSMCDVNINSSIGEGICLPVLEGMACGSIPVVTNYASAPDLIDGNGRLVDVAETVYGAYGVIRGIISKKNLVKHLNDLYYDWKKYKDLEDKKDSICYQYKTKSIELAKKYKWEETVNKIQAVFEEIGLNRNNKSKFVATKINLTALKPVIVIPSWGKNCGIAEYTKSLISSMEKNGESVAIYPSNDLDKLTDHLDKYNCVYFQHEYSFFQDRVQLDKFLEKAREKNVKTVFLMHSFAPLYPYINTLIDKADKIIYHNERFKKLSMAQRPNATNIDVVPMGCSSPFIEDNSEVKNALNINTKTPIIGSFGFLRNQKGYSGLIHAIKKMRDKYPNILCLIVAPPHEFGDKVYDENFFKFVEDQGMQDNVLIVREYLDEERLLKTLNATDIFVLNYKDAPNMGGNSAAVKVLMRLCKPIIVSDSISFFDLDDEVYKIDTSRTKNIIDSIEKTLSDKDLQKTLSDKCKNFVIKNDWLNVAKLHANALKN